MTRAPGLQLRTVLLCLAAIGGGSSAADETPAPAGAGRRLAVPAGLLPQKELPGHGGKTRCAVCHTPQGWVPARFAHDRTGFPLEGRHAQVSCRACHVGTFEVKLPRACAGCHRDPHRGELGQRCEGCHSVERNWESSFDADAHRATNFPLIGRHAALPCLECHPSGTDRRFAGPAVPCLACHERDYQRTALTAINHAAVGFSTECRECHGGWTFRGARFPQHDACFSLSGDHAGIGCTECHAPTVPPVASLGACASGTAACTACHEYRCAEMDAKHAEENVPGYQCKDTKCYECHRFSNAR